MPDSKNKLSFPFIFYFVIIGATVFGQNRIIYPRFLYEGYGDEKPLYIIFHDSVSNKSDSVWLHKINPFNNLPFSSIGKDRQANFYYHLTASEVRSLLPPEIRAGYEQERRKISINDSVYTAGSYSSIFYDSDRFVAIGYTLTIYDIHEVCIGVIGAILLYNSKGNLIFKNDKLKTNVGQLAITRSGDYFSFDYGYSDTFGDLLKSGFTIYDIKNNRMVLDKKTNISGFPIIYENIIINRDFISGENPLKVLYIFDTKTNILYTKKFKLSDTSVLRGLNSNGFLFIDSEGKRRIENFNTFDQQSL